jgi:hypothetical protein
MNKIDKDELFRHLTGFLKAKGVELQEGTYTQQLQRGCGLLADTVNLSQQAIERAKTEMEKQFDQMRQIIHETTAPRTPPPQPQPQPPPTQAKTADSKQAARNKSSSKAKTSSARRRSKR